VRSLRFAFYTFTMRVLHIVHQYPPDTYTGTELYTQQLAGQLATRGHENHVFFRRDGDTPQLEHWVEEAGVQVWAATSKPMTANNRFFATFREPTLDKLFAEALANIQPDLIHVQHLMGLPTSILEQQPIPYVVTLHDYWFLCANAQLVTNYSQEICEGPNLWVNCGRCSLARAGQDRLWWLSPAVAPVLAGRQAWLRPVLANAKAIIAPSNMVATVPERLGMPASRTHIIRHGFRIPDHVQRLPRPRSSGLHIGYVGGLAWQKGVHVLVEAVNGLSETGVQLTIIGDPSAFPDYAQSLREQATHPNIVFAGKLTHAEVWRKLSEFDVVVVPSLWYENAPLVIQEALATGAPVIASDLGAMPEFIENGVNGLLFPAGDAEALRDLLQGLVDDLGIVAGLNAGIQPIRTIAEHVDDIEKVYENLKRKT
jgi:glycosyltransferase involved in cell wall biosynthesis